MLSRHACGKDDQQIAMSVECRSSCGQRTACCDSILTTELHWLDVPERVLYELGIVVFTTCTVLCLRTLQNFASRSQVLHTGNNSDISYEYYDSNTSLTTRTSDTRRKNAALPQT